MVSSSTWQSRLAESLGPFQVVGRLGGGATKVEAGERQLVVKVGAGVGDEAEGLRRLGAVVGGPPVPDVVLVEHDLMVTTWVPQGAGSVPHEESLGAALAVLHAAPCGEWGGGSRWIGKCEVDASPQRSAAEFYGTRMLALADRCALTAPVGRLVERLDSLLPPGGPSLVHGDLWWGNVLWGSDGRGWLIDPSVHGGHPEEDMAMLALFGSVPEELRRAYVEAKRPEYGWEERVPLFQLYPLLVHAVLFGSGYRAQAEAIATRFA